MNKEMSFDPTFLRSMDRAEVVELWREAFGAPPSGRVATDFMRRVLEHHFKMHAEGGLRLEVLKALEDVAAGETVAQPKVGLTSGAQLVREWNGRRYQVEVTETGFVLDRRRFESLTAVARHITGTNWSGPRFFGLKTRKPKATGESAAQVTIEATP
ncbi:MAG: DUF2924 domain-containing protein [Shimia sp.]